MRLKKQIITSGLEYLKDNDIDQYILVEDYLKYNLNCENFYVIRELLCKRIACVLMVFLGVLYLY